MQLGGRLKAAREKSGLLQKDAALKLLITNSQLSRYENNCNFPTPDLLATMCVLYNVGSDYLLGIETSKKPDGSVSVKPSEDLFKYNSRDFLPGFSTLSVEKRKVIVRLVRFLNES